LGFTDRVDRGWREGGKGEKKEKGKEERREKEEGGEKESEQKVGSQDWLATLSRLEEAKRGRARPAEHACRQGHRRESPGVSKRVRKEGTTVAPGSLDAVNTASVLSPLQFLCWTCLFKAQAHIMLPQTLTQLTKHIHESCMASGAVSSLPSMGASSGDPVQRAVWPSSIRAS